MSKYITTLHRSRFIPIALVLTCATALAAGVLSSTYSKRLPQNTPHVTNKTQAFEVAGITENGSAVQLSLKNSYKKNIKAYTVSVGDMEMQEDFIYSDRVISSGEIYAVDVPIPSSGSATKILAVVFEDRTSDGDANNAAEIRNRRSGEKMQMERIHALLANSSVASNDNDALTSLKSQIQSLSEQPENGLPQSARTGLHNSKEEVLQMLQRIEEKKQTTHGLSLQEELSKAKVHFEKKLSKL